MEHKVNKFHNLCKNNPIVERLQVFFSKVPLVFLPNETTMRIPPNTPTWLTYPTINCHMSATSSCSKVCLYAQLRNSQTMSKFAMIMNSFADVYVYMNILSLMEMPTNNLYTTTAVEHVGLHPMAETPT